MRFTVAAERRLIEGQFPCREVGAETKRERGASSSLPPLYFMHVWWARRPLTPSRAAILGSALPHDSSASDFLRYLGIVKKQAVVGNQRWTIVGSNLSLIESQEGHEVITLEARAQRALDKEVRRRKEARGRIETLYDSLPEYRNNASIRKWYDDNAPFDQLSQLPYMIPVVTVPADPAGVNDLIETLKNSDIKDVLGSLRLDPEDTYGYGRAYESHPMPLRSTMTVLDPTAGGGSIPFEALRLGCDVIANDLNPVASVIESATIDYPYRYGAELSAQIEEYGKQLASTVAKKTATYYYFAPLNEREQEALRIACAGDPELYNMYNVAEYDQMGLLYFREATCPHCGERAPLLNAFALQKKANGWAVRPEIYDDGQRKQVRFVPYRLVDGTGPNGEDVAQGTVTDGTGTCIHCGQAIESEEIKRQARGESEHGTWKDVLYCVVGKREQPKLDRNGNVRRYASGPNRGQVVTETVTFFREPVQGDFDALKRAEMALRDNWDRWDAMGLIPTERIPEGNDNRPRIYGMNRWCDMFTPRQLLAALTAMETLQDMIPVILDREGADKGRAIITYLQFMIDKFYDYNSRQTRWEYTRSVIKGTFGRHDFSLKWTFGEMIASGPNSGLDWGLSQVLDAYRGICELLPERRANTVRILNGSAANLSLEDKSVDIICVDPPYYNNVQYAELSDFYYVWDKRTLRDLYPGVFGRRLTNKNDEAVANPVRDGSRAESNERYETLMGEIFKECRRVMKDDGIMVMMFTHKTQAAWETLTRALIENGWIISSTFPVDSESGASMHQRDQAAAASSIFISCRKRDLEDREPAVWEGFGGGVISDVRAAVGEGLASYESLHLNAVDEMVASYGCALRVLSENWPVIDGDDLVSPVTAMREASMVVAQYQMTKLTGGRLDVNDVDAETGATLTLFGIYGLDWFPYDDALGLSKSLNIRLDNQTGGYRSDGHSIGIAPERATRGGRSEQPTIFYAPLVRRGSKLRIAKPEERNPHRLDNPQSEWDVTQGVIEAYRSGDIPVARAYLKRHAADSERKILDILNVLADNMDGEGKKEIRRLLYGMR